MRLSRAWLLALPVAAAGVLVVLALGSVGSAPAPAVAPALMDDGAAPAPAEGRFTDEEYEAHVAALRKRLPGEGFTIVVQKPFVVVGDEAADVVRRRARGTVKWAADRLKESFFAEEPLHILDVWLFKDKASYETNAEKLFGSLPNTKFGYYSARDRALVMNIATGGGTLVHEIVHPFMEANFPGCPPWFNEGMGSLFEQCRERDGKIVGLLNWRLPGLQEAIREKTLPTIEDLTSMTTFRFYGEGRGEHYAMARYLLYRLQEDGLLRRYYREFLAHVKDDPGGYATLVALLGGKDMAAWQRSWEKWVLDLKR